jgi:hypothetical protein
MLLFEVIDVTPMLVDYWSFGSGLRDVARDRDMLKDLDD